MKSLAEHFGLDQHGSNLPKDRFDPYQAFRVANSEEWQERHRRRFVPPRGKTPGSQADQVKRALWDAERPIPSGR